MREARLAAANDVQGALALCAEAICAALAGRPQPALVLAGGTTPRGLYALLASRYRDAVDWRAVRYWFGDERCVARDHPASNFAMAQETLFGPLGIAAGQIERMPGELGPEEGARIYAARLRALSDPPAFDVALLGMGPEGHTASLFPHSPGLLSAEPAVGVRVPVEPEERISLTPRALGGARRVFFLLTGAQKGPALRDALAAPAPLPAVPTSYIRGAEETVFFCDAAAAPPQLRGGG